MKLNSFRLLLLFLLIMNVSLTVRPQPSFKVASLKPYDKAVPGQILDVLIEGLSSGAEPTLIPETDFAIDVLQDGVVQKAKVRITKFTMIGEPNPNTSNRNTIDFAGMKMIPYQVVSFVVPKGLHTGPAEVVVRFKGKRANSIKLEIIEKPLRPVVGTTSVLAIAGMEPERTPMKLEGNDFGWRLERGTTAKVHVNPLVDPDDPNAAVLIRFKQGGNEYDAVTRIISTPSRFFNRAGGVGFMAAREELEVDVPSALTLGKVDVEIRLKANDQIGEPVNLTATITDMTRTAETPNLSAPRVLSVSPKRVGAGQLLLISVDQRRTLEPSPKETKVIIEKDNVRYLATMEKDSLLISASKEPDAPVAFFVRTTRQFIGRVQIRVLNPLRGEQTGMSEPVDVEIVDQVLPPELISVSESTDAYLQRLKQMYAIQQKAGKDFPAYDPDSRYLTIRARGIDLNPKFVRITLQQTDVKFVLTPDDFSTSTADALFVRLPEELTAGEIMLTIANSDGERFSTVVSKSFVLKPRP